MTLPVYLHNQMTGAPTLSSANGAINSLFNACLVNGFNTQNITSATASAGSVTLTMASAAHGFSVKDTVLIAGASNALYNAKCRVASVSGTTVVITNAAAPNGTVAGTLTAKFCPLGWTRPYSGTNLGAYRQGGAATHKRFVRVYDGDMPSSSRFYWRAYENMTAISTGTGPFPTVAEVAGNGGDQIAPTASGFRPWLFVGTPRAFYFSCGYAGDYSANTPPIFAANLNESGISFFGEYADLQKLGDVYGYGISASYTFPGASALWGSRASNQVVNSRPTQTIYGMGIGGAGLGCQYPDAASNGALFGPPPLIYEAFSGVNCIRGFLPGALSGIHAVISGNNLPQGTIWENITGLNGRVMMLTGHIGSGSDIALLLDEDWGDV